MFEREFNNYGFEPEEIDGWIYYFTEGNMGCQCNLSTFTEGMEERDCGDGWYSIKSVTFKCNSFTRRFVPSGHASGEFVESGIFYID